MPFPTKKINDPDVLNMPLLEFVQYVYGIELETFPPEAGKAIQAAYQNGIVTIGNLIAMEPEKRKLIHGISKTKHLALEAAIKDCFTQVVIREAKKNHGEIASKDGGRHFKRSPSHHNTWGHCAGSGREEARYPDNTSDAAEYGTAGHLLGEECILEGGTKKLGNAMTRVGQTRNKIVVDRKMAEQINDYTDLFLGIAEEEGATVFVEQELPLFYQPDETGTSDLVMVSFCGTLHCVDLKMGFYEVDAEDNGQGIIYLLGAYEKFHKMYQPERFVFHIYQPNRFGGKKHTKAEYTLQELLRLKTVIRRQYINSLHPNAPLTPGKKQCKWCKAYPCIEADRWIRDTLKMPVEQQAGILPDPYDISLADCAKLLENEKLITDHISAIKERLEDELHQGNPEAKQLVKYVQGKSYKQVIVDEEQLIATFTDAGVEKENLYTEPTLKTAAQLEDTVAVELFEKFDVGIPNHVERGLVELAQHLDVEPEVFYKPQTLISVAKFEKLLGKKAFEDHADLVIKEGRTRKWDTSIANLDDTLLGLLAQHNKDGEIYDEPKPLAPTRIRGVISEKVLYDQNIVEKRHGKPQMVPISDSRPAISQEDANDDFGDLMLD